MQVLVEALPVAVEFETVMVYVREYKMEMAKRQLLETDGKVNDIAESPGYWYAAHFSAAFKKYHGKSPKDFRSGINPFEN